MGTHDLVLYMTKKKILQISSNVLFIWCSVSYMSMARDYINLSGLPFTNSHGCKLQMEKMVEIYFMPYVGLVYG